MDIEIKGINMTKKIWWCSGSGSIDLQMTLEQAESASHQGECDQDVKDLIPFLKDQLDRIDPDILRKELKEYGAWDDLELSDHESNIQRLVWIDLS